MPTIIASQPRELDFLERVRSFILDSSESNYMSLFGNEEVITIEPNKAITSVLELREFQLRHPDNAFTWLVLGVALSLLGGVKAISRADAERLNIVSAYCASKALSLQKNITLAWITLTVALERGAKVTALSKEAKEIIRKLQGKNNNQQGAYCSGMALICNGKSGMAWSNLGLFLGRGAKVTDLPEEAKEIGRKLQGKNNIQQQAYCYGMALSCNAKVSVIWSNLGVALERGAKVTDLPEEAKEIARQLQGKDKNQLIAYCNDQAEKSKTKLVQPTKDVAAPPSETDVIMGEVMRQPLDLSHLGIAAIQVKKEPEEEQREEQGYVSVASQRGKVRRTNNKGPSSRKGSVSAASWHLFFADGQSSNPGTANMSGASGTVFSEQPQPQTSSGFTPNPKKRGR